MSVLDSCLLAIAIGAMMILLAKISQRIVFGLETRRRVTRYQSLGRVTSWDIVLSATESGRLVVLSRDPDGPSVWWVATTVETPELVHSMFHVKQHGLLVVDPPSTSPRRLRAVAPHLMILINTDCPLYD
jgi:hypothetical protein